MSCCGVYLEYKNQLLITADTRYTDTVLSLLTRSIQGPESVLAVN